MDSEEDSWNELIVQGLTILERLAGDQHNCRDICSTTPGLLPKIMAPLYSNTLIQEITVPAWANVVDGSFKVVRRLISAPGRPGRRLRRQISSSKQAVSNLERILEDSNACQQLQTRDILILTELRMRAIEILADLAYDPYTNLAMETQENLIIKQMQIFLTGDQGKEEKLKVTAGKTLALLSNTKTISVFLMTKYKDIIQHETYANIVDGLGEILDAKNIICRTTALEILENLCIHCTSDKELKEHVKEPLLRKVLLQVLTQVLTSEELRTEAAESNNSAPRDAGENQEPFARGNDEENQPPRKNGQNNSSDQPNEEQTATKELKEALLSLILVICDKLISEEEFYDVSVSRNIIDPEDGGFVAKLKDIVDKNRQAATPINLRIVKLCGQIALSMMRKSHYTKHSKDQEFVTSLSEASKTMSELESCMLFAGTDCGVKKTVRPLLSVLEKEIDRAINPVG